MSDADKTPLQKYNKLLSTGKLAADDGQALAIKELDELYYSLLSNKKNRGSSGPHPHHLKVFTCLVGWGAEKQC